jgi:hypothetical protein
MRYRLYNRLKAHVLGYFWLPCPLCRQMFGGHETGTTLYTGPHEGVCVCPDCASRATELNEQHFKEWETQGALNVLRYER